jgi:hypothetical protein
VADYLPWSLAQLRKVCSLHFPKLPFGLVRNMPVNLAPMRLHMLRKLFRTSV